MTADSSRLRFAHHVASIRSPSDCLGPTTTRVTTPQSLSVQKTSVFGMAIASDRIGLRPPSYEATLASLLPPGPSSYRTGLIRDVSKQTADRHQSLAGFG